MDATRSLVYKVNRVGPMTLPWGTPEDTEQRLDLCRFKDGFPYFDLFDEVMGHRDSVDPSKIAKAKMVLPVQLQM